MTTQNVTLDAEGSAESFEVLYRRLEEIVDRLDAGGLNLDESIDLYAAGMQLARRCKEMLDAAELRVSELQQEFAGDGLEDALSDDEED